MNENEKKIWITGASSGIGKALAIKFANNGWQVAASARRENLLQDLSKINSNISGESLRDTFERVSMYYEKKIEPLLTSKKNILIVFHGNSCRALLKKIFNISNKKIIELEIPTGNPLLITFDEDLKVKNYNYLDNKRAKKILFNV